MGRRTDRQARKRDKRLAEQILKAQRRGDALALLEASVSPLADPSATLELVLRDAEACLRQSNDARARSLARALSKFPELLAALGDADPSLAPGIWVVLAALLRGSQWDLAERLLPVLARPLGAAAPELLAWASAYLEHRGQIPEDRLVQLPRLASAAGIARQPTRPSSFDSPEQLEQALLAVADQPEGLAHVVASVVDGPQELQVALAPLAAQLSWRASLASVRQRRSPRTSLAALAKLVGTGAVEDAH